MTEKRQDIIEVPGGEREVLLHTCCAPCSSAIIETLLLHGVRPVIFYSNSNIYPDTEYQIRKNECSRFAAIKGLEIIDDDYDHKEWLKAAKGMELAPERGLRCTMCFRYRLERAARYAYGHGFKVIATTLASSRWKDLDQINAAGEFACSLYPGLIWWGMNWRKGGLQQRRQELIKENDFYNQQYCGCEFSRRY